MVAEAGKDHRFKERSGYEPLFDGWRSKEYIFTKIMIVLL